MAGDWQNFSRDISGRVAFIFESSLFTDCEFIVGPTFQVKSHKLILAMGSPVFQAMFYGSNPAPSGPIEITDIDPSVFSQILAVLYGAEPKINSCKNACDLYYAAKKYLMKFLERDCVEYLKEHLDPENVLSIYDFSQFHDEVDLQNRCLEEMQQNTVNVLSCNNLREISFKTLSALLESNKLNVPSELQLFKAIEMWLEQNQESKDCEKNIGNPHPLLRKLRLLTLTVDEFKEGPFQSKYLSDSDKLSILLRIIGSVTTPMNNGLCELRKKRKPGLYKSLSILNIEEFNEARCDGSEWLTSIFKTNSHLELLGVEIRSQTNGYGSEYVENMMVKVGYANDDEYFAEGSLNGTVQYDSKAQVLFKAGIALEPNKEYAIHLFLCQPGMYPIGRHTSLKCQDDSVVIEFVSHTSWERAHPYNSTVISSLIYTENPENEG